jgi:hypothetical protein
MCPGRHFADAALYSTIVTILATCIISKPIDDEGEEYEPHVKFSGLSLRCAACPSRNSFDMSQTPLVVREMEPFTVHVQPRSDHAVALLKGTMNT